MPVLRNEPREFVDLNEWQVREIRKGIDEADREEFASDKEVEQSLKRWTRRRPTCDGRFKMQKKNLRRA